MLLALKAVSLPRHVFISTVILLIGVAGLNAGTIPPIKTVFVILLENESWSQMEGNTNAPYLNSTLLSMASCCEAYHNVPDLHPSLPNYIWLEAGTNFGILDDSSPDLAHQNTTNHFVTLLQNAGISWKTYHENITGTNVPLTDWYGYVVRHNPFVYFDDVTGTNNPAYAYGISHIRPYSELAADLTNNTVACYNFLKPNICNDGHDSCSPLFNPIRQVDAWLAAEVPGILNSQAYKNDGALFITWDEAVEPDPRVGMILLSPLARGNGYRNSIYYTHSSTLRTFQEIFGVGPFLGDASNATDLSDLFLQFGIDRLVKMPSGAIHITAIGITPGRTNIVEASTDLKTWSPISTNVATSTSFATVDVNAPDFTQRYYRLLQLP